MVNAGELGQLAELLMHHRHGLKASLVLLEGVLDGRVLEVVGLEPREARDELQVVFDPVVELPQQQRLLRQGACERGDVLEGQQNHGLGGVLLDEAAGMSRTVRRPMVSKVCVTSKSRTSPAWGAICSRSSRRRGISHWPLPN